MDISPLLPEPALNSDDLVFFVHIEDLRNFKRESDQNWLREAVYRSYQLKKIKSMNPGEAAGSVISTQLNELTEAHVPPNQTESQ